MPTTYTLTLDTIAPGGLTFSLENGAAYTSVQEILTTFATTDADSSDYQVKFWGDVDPEANSAVQVLEGDSQWVTWADDLYVMLADFPGIHSVSFRARDDVGNESGVLSDTIILDDTLPTPDINVVPDRTKISKVTGFNESHFSFIVAEEIQAWKVKVVSSTNATEGQGTLIPMTGGSINTSGAGLAAATAKPVTITGEDLETASPGDGAKIIKVFVQDMGGAWSV